MDFKVGDKLCNCTLLKFCGNGAYGEVWLAEDAIGTRIALKILRNRNSYSERELNGLKNYKDCNHPNLLKIRYVEVTDNAIYYTMDAADDLNCGRGEYLPDTLANRLHKFGRLDGKEITRMLDDLLAGLEELHQKGLVHRDIKPDNIIWVNGRATLADVGLIANDGANSLVGTPGFLSPRVLNGKPAEASDDFYALGKVIYCALTGLAVTEYPSLPTNVTISMDANLNRALRESCSHPVNSTAEFRELLKKQKTVSTPERPHPSEKFSTSKIFIILLFVALAGVLFYLFSRQKEQKEIKPVPLQQRKAEIVQPPIQEKATIVKPIEIAPEAEKRLTELQNAEKDFQQELQTKVINIFEKSGWLNNNKMLPFLVNYQLMSREEMQSLLFNSNSNPRLVPTAGVHRKTIKNPTRIEQTLFSMLMEYAPDFDKKQVRERQQYWRNKGNLKTMLTTDTLMQAIALDAIIRHGINNVLKNGRFQGNEEADLKELLSLRRYLLDLEWGKLQYISKKNLPQNR